MTAQSRQPFTTFDPVRHMPADALVVGERLSGACEMGEGHVPNK